MLLSLEDFSPCCRCACATRKRPLFPPVVIYGSQFLNRESLKVIRHRWQSLRTKAKSFSFSCHVFISAIFLLTLTRLLKICQTSSLCRPAQGLCDFRDKGQQSGDHLQNHRLHPSPGQRRDLLGARRRFLPHLGT